MAQARATAHHRTLEGTSVGGIMSARGRLRVAVIYKHPLLGEGIGRMLAAEPDMAVSQALCDDAVRTAAVVSAEPDVVVLERNCTLGPTDILRSSPDTLVIETSLHAGATWAYRRQEIPNRPEAVIALVRRLRTGHPAVMAENGEEHEPVTPAETTPVADAHPAKGTRPAARPIGELVHGS